jgi:hypothetical protein
VLLLKTPSAAYLIGFMLEMNFTNAFAVLIFARAPIVNVQVSWKSELKRPTFYSSGIKNEQK